MNQWTDLVTLNAGGKRSTKRITGITMNRLRRERFSSSKDHALRRRYCAKCNSITIQKHK